MKLSTLLLLICLAATACNRDNPPAPVVIPQQPALSETIKTTDALRLDGLYLTYRSSNRQAYVASGFDFVVSDSVREVGFCLSDSDSLLSILRPDQDRIKVLPANYNQRIFWAELPTLQAGRTYYIDSYVVFQSGRVLYGRNNASSFISKKPQIGVSSFVLPATDTTGYSPLQVVRKAALPVPTATNFFASFSINNGLYVLGGDGSLFLYDAVGDRWEKKQSLKTRVLGTDTDTHFNGTHPVAFSANNTQYVYFAADGLGRLIENVWAYNPVQDKWTFVTDQFTLSPAGAEFAYTAGNQAYLYNSFQRKIFSFNSVDNSFRAISQIKEPAYGLAFVPGSSQPLALTYQQNSQGTALSRYDLSSGLIVDAQPLFPLQINITPAQHVVTGMGADVLLGAGKNRVVGQGQSLPLTVAEMNDGLVRYSTTTNKITARYSLKTFNDSYWNQQVRAGNQTDLFAYTSLVAYTTLVAGSHVYVIDALQGSLTELVF